MTLSGGEPLAQAGFLERLLPELKNREVHVTLETCGLVGWQRIAALLPFIDLVYFDLKVMDGERHARHTGIDNGAILENFTRLAETDIALQARMPVIPGINDNDLNVRDTAEFLLKNGQTSIHLLPYHTLGEAKIPRLNTSRQCLDLPVQTPAELKRVKDLFTTRGIEVALYD